MFVSSCQFLSLFVSEICRFGGVNRCWLRDPGGVPGRHLLFGCQSDLPRPSAAGRRAPHAPSVYRVETTENDTRIHVDVYVQPRPTYCPTRTCGQLLNLRDFPELFPPRFTTFWSLGRFPTNRAARVGANIAATAPGDQVMGRVPRVRRTRRTRAHVRDHRCAEYGGPIRASLWHPSNDDWQNASLLAPARVAPLTGA